MFTTVPPAQRRAAKQQLLADLQHGYLVQETQARAVIPCHPATIYRLRQRLQTNPVTALADGRHGHPVKLRGEVRDWLGALCQAKPHTPSHIVQAALQEHFGLLVSVSQLNRFRAAHGLSCIRTIKLYTDVPHEPRKIRSFCQRFNDESCILARFLVLKGRFGL